jgi:tripartite-type tricarboxylate transporter receptor subunit TctC
VEILNEAVRNVADMPAIQAQFRDLGVEARASTPAEIHERLVADIAKWGEVIESTEIETP